MTQVDLKTNKQVNQILNFNFNYFILPKQTKKTLLQIELNVTNDKRNVEIVHHRKYYTISENVSLYHLKVIRKIIL